MKNRSKWLIESGILDLAAGIMMIRWIRKREEAQALGGFEAGYANDAKWRKVVMIVDLVRRLVGSQAFFLLALAIANEESWLGRNVRVLWTAVVGLLQRPGEAVVAIARRDEEYPVRSAGRYP
jgi:NhaP-type Na+/H+ or K+/H+ antiporter